MGIIGLLLLCMLCLGNPLLEQGYTQMKTVFGGRKYTKMVNEGELHAVVEPPHIDEMSTEFITRANERLRGEREVLDVKNLNCDWGDGPNYFRLFPQFKASAKIGGGQQRFSTHCFNEVTVEVTDSTEDSVTIALKSSHRQEVFCYDSFLVSILNSIHLDMLSIEGSHTFVFKNLSPDDMYDIQLNGVRVFIFCDGIYDLLVDTFMTLKMFLGGFTTHPDWGVFGSHVTEYMAKANIEFLQNSIGYTMEKRTHHRVQIDKSQIHSGDFLAITRLDGIDEIIMYGSGSHVGHSTMALWVEENGERELYVAESQDGWYWPRHGLQINKFDQWIEWADNASFNVVVLPLKEEVRAKFDEKAVYDYFKTVEGMPYGYHNFLFGWIDTPRDNFPAILNAEFVLVAFRLVEKIVPSAIELIFNEAINKRLGTSGLTMTELEVEAGKQGMSLLDVMAIPEKDGWWYSEGYSYVCSSFVLRLYIEAGILGDLELQGTEFTPRDVYSLSLFDTKYQRPQACIDADPDIPYCQILGDYRIKLGTDYGSIDPYSHMNEKCPSIAPEFLRPDGC